MTVSQLIDVLVNIKTNSISSDSDDLFDSFTAEDSRTSFKKKIKRKPSPIFESMRELVRRGPSALPELVDHIEDSRPTTLITGNDYTNKRRKLGVNLFMFTVFGQEYVPKLIVLPMVENGTQAKDTTRRFDGPYMIKIADICFYLIGQIVNRDLYSLRYVPTLGLIINSPIESPILAIKIKKDWANVDAEQLKQSLLSDIRSTINENIEMTEEDKEDDSYIRTHLIHSAFKRLRFYYPDTYASLAGDELVKRKEFEKEEAKLNAPKK